MDSDIDADTPVRIKPLKRILEHDIKSPTLPSNSSTMPKSNKAASPTSTYSTKSTKDQLDVSEIRRVLRKLRIELDIERKRNQELEYNMKQLTEDSSKMEGKYKDSVAKINSYRKNSEDAVRFMENNKNNEISQLRTKLEELSNLLSIRDNGIDFSNILKITSRMDYICCNEYEDQKNWTDMKSLVNRLKYSLKTETEKDHSESKLVKLRNHNNELTKIVRLLDLKLNKANIDIETLNKKLEIRNEHEFKEYENTHDQEGDLKLDETLHHANVEIIQLQKQITWLKNTENGNPATKERVEVLSGLIHSFKDNQKKLEQDLSILREKCNNVEKVTNDLSRVKNENNKLLLKLGEFPSLQRNIEILRNSLSLAQASDQEKLSEIEKLEFSNNQYRNKISSMERLLKYIRETSEKRTELDLEYAAMKTLLETKLQQKFMKQKDQNQYDHEENSDESTENLKIKIREMEKRRTQQALNYEEALLELEALKKTNQRQNIDFYRRNGAKDVVNNSATSSLMEGLLGNMEIGKIDIREGLIFGRPEDSSAIIQDDLKYLIEMKNGGNSNFGLVKDFQEEVKNEKQRKHVSAPVQIKVENHQNQPSSKVIRWKSPDVLLNDEDCRITSYHIYLDGDFYKAIGDNEPMSIVLPNLDSKTHRVSVRSVCPSGQSKDAQCTIEINSNTPSPSVLKANKIAGTSAHVSWMPSNSTLRHVVWVNGVKYCDCLPGVYKIFLQGLTADSLQKVRVHPVLEQYPDSTTISAYLDFQTLPVTSEYKMNTSKKQIGSVIEEIEPPRNVKLKLGNRSGRFLVRWTCSSEPSTSLIKLVGYSILINNQCIALVNGAKNDRFNLNLVDLREISLPINPKLLNFNEQSFLALTVRTLGTITEIDSTDCTVQSKDSQPPLKFSGQVAARIAGTAAEAAMMLGDQLAFFLNLNSRSSKSSPKDHSQGKMSVPKIQITKDSSFSEDDENLPLTQHNTKSRIMTDPYKEKFQNRGVSNQHFDFANRPNPTPIDPPANNQPKLFQSSPNERVPLNQRSNNYNNGIINGVSPSGRYYYGNQSTNDAIRFYVALYDYDPGTMSPNPDAVNEELPFKAGQTVKIFGQVDEDGFYTGETNGRRGLVPSNMVKEIDNSNIKSKFKNEDNQNDQFVERTLKKNKEMPISRNIQPRPNMNQYSSDSHNEYSSNQYIGNPGHYEPGQISHRKSTDSGVSYATTDQNSYQKINNVPKPSVTAPTRLSLNGKKMIALYDYDPQVLSPNVDSDAELAFKANDVIIILSEIDEDGFYLGERNGQRGLVPSNFLVEAVTLSTRLRNQQSFDGPQNQNNYKERNISASSNFSDPPPAKDNRYKTKVMDNEVDIPRNMHGNNEDYMSDKNLEIEHQKSINNMSYEDSFDSVPSSTHHCAPKPEPKHVPYQPTIERRCSINNGVNIVAHEHQYPRTVTTNIQMPVRISKPTEERRIVYDKPNHPPQSSITLPPRRQSPPPSLEQDDMPIVMDLAPSKDNQKKKKLSSAPDNYRTNLSEPHENYSHNDNLYANSNSSMSDNLERKRSVFKNPFKKKKS